MTQNYMNFHLKSRRYGIYLWKWYGRGMEGGGVWKYGKWGPKTPTTFHTPILTGVISIPQSICKDLGAIFGA